MTTAEAGATRRSAGRGRGSDRIGSCRGPACSTRRSLLISTSVEARRRFRDTRARGFRWPMDDRTAKVATESAETSSARSAAILQARAGVAQQLPVRVQLSPGPPQPVGMQIFRRAGSRLRLGDAGRSVRSASPGWSSAPTSNQRASPSRRAHAAETEAGNHDGGGAADRVSLRHRSRATSSTRARRAVSHPRSRTLCPARSAASPSGGFRVCQQVPARPPPAVPARPGGTRVHLAGT